MTSIENLPNEILLKILSYLNITELCRFTQVSKWSQKICKDDSLQKKCVEKMNLRNKKVPIEFLAKILEKGCKYLSIKSAFLEFDENLSAETIRLMPNVFQLKYLHISGCRVKPFVLQSILERCNQIGKRHF